MLRLARPLPLLLLCAWLLQRGGHVPVAASAAPDRVDALVLALKARGLLTRASDVHWLDPSPGFFRSRWARPRAVVRAHRAGEPSDIYLVRARLAPGGRLLALPGVYNLTGTSAVDERQLVASDNRVAWVLSGGGRTYTVHFADLRGTPPPRGKPWTWFKRWQEAVTQFENTGQLAGIVRREFQLDPAARRVRLAFTPRALTIDADAHRMVVATDGTRAIEGRLYLRERSYPRALPGNWITWAVDRVRALPWFGSNRMQFVKAVAFDTLDWLQRVRGRVTGDDGSAQMKKEYGSLLNEPLVTYTDPETGWPPPLMKPILSPALPGEGRWRALDHDPFIRTNPGAPAPFVQSFIRTDPERRYAEVFVLMWDPRQVALHEMSGTVEPKSATGETGPGLVPRTPFVLRHFLGGFNGGFQATHGEYGMMVNRIVYLPPKPYAATVAELADGSTAFGTWPNDPAIPNDMLSFRQNMTPLVQGGVYNPYDRNWWGGVPPGWTDKSRSVRSALCLTQEGFVAYLYGSSIDADHLAKALLSARCKYGIHLDMNPGHTGLEFYRAAPAGELPDLHRKLDPQWEAEGDVPGMAGWRFLGRRMLRYMGLMNFPRYIHRQARDFFYMTLRPVLPGATLPLAFRPAEPGEGVWRVKDLPQHGWPYAIATAWVRPDAARPNTKVRVLRIDPKAVAVGRASDAAPLVLALHPAPLDDPAPGVWLIAERFAISHAAPAPEAERIAAGFEPNDARAAQASAALGVDADGMLVYAEVATAPRPGADAPMLISLLKRAGCSRPLLLSQRLGVALGGDRDLAGQPVAGASGGVSLVRRRVPGARRIFEQTPIVKPSVWYPLQARRVRYFEKAKPAPAASASSGAIDGGAPP
jgi:hypothetical protein